MFASLLIQVKTMYSDLLPDMSSVKNVVNSTEIFRNDELMIKRKKELSNQSKTSKLWLRYQKIWRLQKD